MSSDRFTPGFLERFFRTTKLGGRKTELQDQLISFLSHSPNIPTFPAIIQQIDKLIRLDNYTLDEVEAIAKLDPSLAAQIIRAANTSIYGGGNIHHLRGCLQRLGLRQLRSVLCLHGTISSFYGFKVKTNWDQFWHHSILTARLTEAIYPSFAEPSGNEYLAGLLHDSGRLFLQRIFVEEFSKTLTLMKTKGFASEAADLEVYGFSHADVSSNLCDRWGLGDRIVQAVHWHHEPTSKEVPAESALLAAVLAVADLYANAYHVNLDEVPRMAPEAIQSSPLWHHLETFPKRSPLQLDLKSEVLAVDALTHALLQTA